MFNIMPFLLSAILVLSPVASGQAPETSNFDNSKISSGVIGAKFIPETEKRIKVRIQKDSVNYDYDLFGRDKFEYFPLQMGDGTYKVFIYENVSGTKYRLAKNQEVTVTLSDQMSVYLASVQNINWNNDMAIVKKAADLTKNCKTDKEKVSVIYNFVVKNIQYDYQKAKTVKSPYIPNIEDTVNTGKGICYDYSSLFAAMLRSQGIPTKLIMGYSSLVTEYHAWNEVYLTSEKRWVTIDTTYDSAKIKAGKKPSMEKDKKKYKSSKEY